MISKLSALRWEVVSDRSTMGASRIIILNSHTGTMTHRILWRLTPLTLALALIKINSSTILRLISLLEVSQMAKSHPINSKLMGREAFKLVALTRIASKLRRSLSS